MRILAFDTETYLISKVDKAPKPVVCSWSDGARSWLTLPGDPMTLQLWSDPTTVFVGVNIPYDLLVMMRWHPSFIPAMIRALDEGRVFDCATRESLCYLAQTGAEGYDARPSLAKMALKYLKLDLSASKQGEDIWRLKYGTLDGVPLEQWPAEARDYALSDAKHTWDIFAAQGGTAGIQPTEQMQVQAATALHAIGVWGFKINTAVRDKLAADLAKQIEEGTAALKPTGWLGEGSKKKITEAVTAAWSKLHAKQLQEFATATGVGFIGNPPFPATDLAGWLKGGHAIPWLSFPPGYTPMAWCQEAADRLTPVALTEKGQIQASEEVLETLKEALPTANLYLATKHAQKMKTTYVDAYDSETVHPSFVPIVSTGRTGCREPNCQNVPSDQRKMFMPRAGMTFGVVDYSQLELCTLAATIRFMFPGIECKMGDAIDKGMDVHCMTGGTLAGLSYEQMIKGKAEKDEQVGKFRQAAKACNFGLPGGLGKGAFASYAKTQYGVEMSEHESGKAIDAWKNTWPEMRAYLREAGRTCENGHGGRATGYTISGRAKAGCYYSQLANYRFQGLAADGAKAATYACWRETVLGGYWRLAIGSGYGSELRDAPLAQSHIVNFVHDEIVMEHALAGDPKAALRQQEQHMVTEMTKWCRGLITIKAEGKLSEEWKK